MNRIKEVLEEKGIKQTWLPVIPPHFSHQTLCGTLKKQYNHDRLV